MTTIYNTDYMSDLRKAIAIVKKDTQISYGLLGKEKTKQLRKLLNEMEDKVFDILFNQERN